MRKILVSDTCEGCGYCLLESNLLHRLPSGKASPLDGGLFTDEQYEVVKKMIATCPVKAISCIDDGTEGMPESTRPADANSLKKFIDEQLLAFSIKKPSRAELKFDPNDYAVPFSSVSVLSNFEFRNKYKWDRGAEGAGLDAFEKTIYSQRKTLVKQLVATYKKNKLEKYLHLTQESGNFYHDVNVNVSNLLQELRVLTEDLTKGKIALPADFIQFESGPDIDYNSQTACGALRNIETIGFCETFQPATDYSCYIDTDDNGDKERYDLRKAMRVFADDLKRQLAYELESAVVDMLQKALKPFETAVRKKIAEKVEILKTELKKCSSHAPKEMGPDSDDAGEARPVSDEIIDLLEKLKHVKLIKLPSLRKCIDRQFDSSHRFSSQSQCREAAINRLTRYCAECESYLSPNGPENISDDLSTAYQKQIINLFSNIKTKLQEIYDRHNLPYPNHSFELSSQAGKLSLSLSDFQPATATIDQGFRQYLNTKVIGECGKVKSHQYILKTDGPVEISERDYWGKNWLGSDKKEVKYGYWLDLDEIEHKFSTGCSDCCDYAFDDGYLQSCLNELIRQFTSELEVEIHRPQ